MGLAESISAALSGRSSGEGFRVRTVCHNGADRNLYLAESSDDKLIATCFSHGCNYRKIMEALESQGLKPRMEFTGKQRQTFIQKKNKRQLLEALQIELHILLQFMNERSADVAKAADRNYLKLNPEFTPMPEAIFKREMIAATRIKKIIGQIYDN